MYNNIYCNGLIVQLMIISEEGTGIMSHVINASG